jgi:hypothetical protein
MPSLPNKPDNLTTDGRYCLPATTHRDLTVDATSPAVEDGPAPEVSAQPVFISEQEVLLGTAAALADPPSIDTENVAAEGDPASTSGWIGILARWLMPSWGEPSTHQEDPLGRSYFQDSRMAREMYRL